MSTRNQTRKRSNSLIMSSSICTSTNILNEKIPYKCKWNIDNDLLNKFLQCDIDDKYQSKIFDNLWRFSCYPNGNKIDNKGKLILCIELCAFPMDITKIKLRIKLLCPELNKIWSTITDFEKDRKLSKSWSSSTLFKKELNGYQQISFIAEIFVIQQSYYSIIVEPKTYNISSLDGNYKSTYFQNKDRNYILTSVINKLFKENIQKHDISNFDEKENNVMNFDQICDLIKEYYPINVAIWNIKDKMLLNRLIVSKNQDKYDSDIFEICGFKWFLRIYPNGYNKKNKDYFQCFLSIATLPPSIKNIFANVRLSCPQTMTSYTFFADYTSKHKTWGWSHNMGQNELHSLFLLNKYKQLTFLCQIKILKITSSLPPHSNIYEMDIPYFNQELMITDILNIKYKHEWHINKELMLIFRKSPNGKMYESSIFNDMFCIQIYPNGVNKQNIENIQVFCQICAFPKGVSAILAKLELLCPQIGDKTHWQHLVKFTQNDNNWGWDSDTITINDLYKYDQLTISAKIQFVQLYDEEGIEKNKLWKREESLSDIEDAQHDEKTPHEHDSSHRLLELENFKLVQGFIKRINDNDIYISSDKNQFIIDLITKFSMDETHELFDWDISKPLKTVKFTALDPLRLHSKHISDIFRFHNLNWILQMSYLSTNNSFYHIMLTLCCIPSVLSQVVSLVYIYIYIHYLLR